MRVDLRNNQGNVRVHPKGAGVVNHHTACFPGDGRKLLADRSPGREEADIDSCKGVFVQDLHGIGLSLKLHPRACASSWKQEVSTGRPGNFFPQGWRSSHCQRLPWLPPLQHYIFLSSSKFPHSDLRFLNFDLKSAIENPKSKIYCFFFAPFFRRWGMSPPSLIRFCMKAGTGFA